MRFKDGREHRLTMSQPTEDDPVLIVCPQCAGKAAVVPCGAEKVRASCFACGYTREQSSKGRALYWSGADPTDDYFGYDLWLSTDCQGHALWAFNTKHLAFLESYVSATLRERTKDAAWGWSNASVASRLPQWIKSAKNRDALLRAIRELKAKA